MLLLLFSTSTAALQEHPWPAEVQLRMQTVGTGTAKMGTDSKLCSIPTAQGLGALSPGVVQGSTV